MNTWFIKRTLLASTLAVILDLPRVLAVEPTITNVRASQRAQSQLVDIFYDLNATAGASFAVSLHVYTNSEFASHDFGATNFTGDGIGPAVTSGMRKHIVWDAGGEWPGRFSSAVYFDVLAYENYVPLGMALIPAGSFVMGATTNVGHEFYSGETPQHTVSVTAFFMDRCEVTKALWDDVANWATTHGYDISAGSGSGKDADHPVQTVTWYECVKWCNARSEKDGLTPPYTNSNGSVYTSGSFAGGCNWSANGYRLPTEAEWEKAARGGVVNHRFPWSDSDEIQHARANYWSSSSYAYDTSPTRGYNPTYATGATPYTSPVGVLVENDYGLFDMAGNVWEWCWDRYSSGYYGTSPSVDPRGPTSGSLRVMRGNSWYINSDFTRVAARFNYGPASEFNDVGFRCARGL